ncbi:unnamed protein product [Owenia fusiformis]|uniref:C-type lectin domain-containing protein n=1 Tax=Owenia fusiformis TaxID=6347 RepID=A0A8S4NK33_OWEFU|nr:unnamed protein product [Owenia fusiformis]
MEMMLSLTPIFVLGLVVTLCIGTDIATMQWNGKKIQYFDRATALFEQSEDCLPGFFKGVWQNETCYMFVTAELTRSEASTFCTEGALGNGLVAIPTELHHAHIVGQIVMQTELRASSSSSQYYWTSGENFSGLWTWGTSLEPFNYTKFWTGSTPSTGFLALYESRSASPSPYYDWISTTSITNAYRSICQHFIVSR